LLTAGHLSATSFGAAILYNGDVHDWKTTGELTMITAIRQKVTVGRGGVISLRSPELKPGMIVEVIVLIESETETPIDAVEALHGRGKGQGLTQKLLEERAKDREKENRNNK
jgi:hypothetical protein